MKKAKKFLSLVLVMLIFISVIPFSANAKTIAETGQCGEDVYWNFNATTGQLTIYGTGDMYHYGSDNSPFQYGDTIKSVIIENGITSIGQNTFWCCTNLESVTISDSVTSISFYAFIRCAAISNITVEKNNNYYSSENGVLFNKEKTTLIKYPSGKPDVSYTIPNSVTHLFEDAFESSTNLTSITIPDSVINIDWGVFASCTNLTSIIIPDSVTDMGIYTFAHCTNLESVTIGNGVTNIGQHTFYECSNLKSITITNSVHSIDSSAFEYCTNLTDVYYKGTIEQWNAIEIDSYNESLLNANIHFLGENINDKPTQNPTEPVNPDTPTTPDEPENKPCSCNCHKGGIAGFFFRIINFFEKLFGKNKVCACGVKH